MQDDVVPGLEAMDTQLHASNEAQDDVIEPHPDTQFEIYDPQMSLAGISEATYMPVNTFTAVEYPGFVRNANKALDAMGGEQAVPVTYEGQLVRLALRSNEPYSHSLYADAKPCRCILIKVVKRKTQTPPIESDANNMLVDTQQQPQIRAEVVGTVQTMLQFSGMADYQYLPADTTFTARDLSKCPAVNAPERAEPSGVLQPLLVVPPLFSKHDIPLDYAYKQFNFQGECCMYSTSFHSTSLNVHCANVPADL